MPIHDWSRVDDGLFHHFHQAWIGQLSRALNEGLLPPSFYALAEQHAGRMEPDILTLHAEVPGPDRDEPEVLPTHELIGTTILLESPPQVDVTQMADSTLYVRKQNRVVVRHASNDRVIALIEVVSRGNKSSEYALERFVEKVCTALWQGIHVVVLDLHPPGTWDPRGLHHAIWQATAGQPFEPPAEKDRTLAAYRGGVGLAAFVQPSAVHDVLASMPLFLSQENYVPLPSEETYQAAFRDVPQRWRAVLDARA
jgi:hypothetical protein